MEMEQVRVLLFFGILVVAAWQDLRSRNIGCGYLMMSFCIGLCMSVFSGRCWGEVILACSPGIILLGLGGLTGGGIGEGDGWFFVVSGMFISVRDAIWLLFGGLCACFCVSLPLIVWRSFVNGGKKRSSLPFLPFLVPGGFRLVVQAFGAAGAWPV